MEQIEQLAQVALEHNHHNLRSLMQDVTCEKVDWSKTPHPSTNDGYLLVSSTALVKLLAERSHQGSPAWTQEIVALKELFLLESVMRMKRLRLLCKIQSPEPKWKCLLYAPPRFLEFA